MDLVDWFGGQGTPLLSDATRVIPLHYPIEPYNQQAKSAPPFPGISLRSFMENTTTYEDMPVPFAPLAAEPAAEQHQHEGGQAAEQCGGAEGVGGEPVGEAHPVAEWSKASVCSPS